MRIVMDVYRTLDDVVDGLVALEGQLRARGDRRAIFTTLYGIVSAEIRAQVAAGRFADSHWVHRYAVSFANLYRLAFLAYEERRMDAVPKAWRLCFDAAASGTGLVLVDMFLGVNAHVNHDLPYAIDGIGIGSDRELRYRDHAAVNAVLASVTDSATARIAALYAPGLTAADDCAGELDERISLFSLAVARDSAWESALALSQASALERKLIGTVIAGRSAAMAKLLLAPSSNPALTAACHRIEQGTGWLALLHALGGAAR